MEYEFDPGPADWQELKSLEAQLEAGRLLLNDSVTSLLVRVAPGLGVPAADVKIIQESEERTRDLIVELRRRIRAGSRALMAALADANRLKKAGDLEAARAVLEVFFESEAPGFHRETARAQCTVLGL